jgi:hypothetical protein
MLVFEARILSLPYIVFEQMTSVPREDAIASFLAEPLAFLGYSLAVFHFLECHQMYSPLVLQVIAFFIKCSFEIVFGTKLVSSCGGASAVS